MDYLLEILPPQRRDKLAYCWLAAILKKEVFMRKYGKSVIMQQDIPKLCEEIMKLITSNGRKFNARRNFYLSVELMLGVVRLHFYQTSICVVLMESILLSARPMEREKITQEIRKEASNDIYVPELPKISLSDNFMNLENNQDAHLLRECTETYAEAGDILNFGVLTSDALEYFHSHILADGTLEQSAEMHETFRRFNEELERSEPDISLFSPRRAFRMSNGTQTNIDASNLISSNNEFFKVPDVPMPDQQLEQNIEIRLPEEEARTPRKRKSVVVPEPLTPSKRLNLEEQPEDTVEVPVVEASVAQAAIDAAQNVTELELEPLEPEYSSQRRKLPKQKIDLVTQLTINRETLNPHVYSVPSSSRQANLPQITARELLEIPNTFSIFKLKSGRKWAEHLLHHFNNCVKFFEIERHREIIEEIRETTVTEKTTEPSSVNIGTSSGKSTTNITTDVSGVVEMLDDLALRDPIEDVEARKSVIPEMPPEMPLEMPPEIPPESEELEVPRKLRTPTKLSQSSDLSSQHSLPEMTQQDLLAYLQVCWRDNRFPTFFELCPPETETPEEAASCFMSLLTLATQERITLTQNSPYEEIEISSLSSSQSEE